MKVSYIYLLLLFVSLSCVDDYEVLDRQYPSLFMSDVSVTEDGAQFTADIKHLGSLEVHSLGFEWHPVEDPESVISRRFNTNEIKVGKLSMTVNTDLRPGIDYEVRPFAFTSRNRVYGTSMVFTSKGSLSPFIESYSPKSGFDGQEIVFNGSNLNQTGISVYIARQGATITSANDEQLNVKIPRNHLVGNVLIEIFHHDDLIYSNSELRLIGPSISDFSVHQGFPGEDLTIFGSNLIENGPTVSVSIGEQLAVVKEAGSSEVTVEIPFPQYENYQDKTEPVPNTIILTNGNKQAISGSEFSTRNSWKILGIASQFDHSFQYKPFVKDGSTFILEHHSKRLLQLADTNGNWTVFSTFPGEPEDNGEYIVLGDTLYKLGGRTIGLEFVDKIWKFSFTTREWLIDDLKTPFSLPQHGAFFRTTSFVIDDIAYIVTDQEEVWSYTGQVFTRLNDFPQNVEEIFSHVIDGSPYIIINESDWIYDVATDQWTNVRINPFKYRNSKQSGSFVVNNRLFMLHNFAGEGGLYHLKHGNFWEKIDEYPGCTFGVNKALFVQDNTPFFLSTYGGFACSPPTLYSYIRPL